MARRRVDQTPVETPVEAAPVETPVEAAVEEPAVEPVQVQQESPAPKAGGKPRPDFAGDPDEVHRKYFVPPIGYQKPKFPSSI